MIEIFFACLISSITFIAFGYVFNFIFHRKNISNIDLHENTIFGLILLSFFSCIPALILLRWLKPKLHLEKHSWVTFNEPKRLIHIDTLDSYNIVDCNFLHMDTQGYELEILKGSEETLKYIDYIYTEINIMELYENCVQLEELDEYLKSKNFIRTELILTGYGAGDALYIKKLGENLK